MPSKSFPVLLIEEKDIKVERDGICGHFPPIIERDGKLFF
jgi:hypothetical protein